MSTQTSSTSSHNASVRVTDINITFDKLYNPSRKLIVSVGGQAKAPVWKSIVEDTYRWTFDQEIDISSKPSFTVQPQHRRVFIIRKKGEPITLPVEDLLRSCSSTPDKRPFPRNLSEWRKSYPQVDITIGLFRETTLEVVPKPEITHRRDDELSSLPLDENGNQSTNSSSRTELSPTTDDLFRVCPRFRVLVIGKTGVGKSSLINHAFGVDQASISHDKAGVSNINFEILSNQNERFVVHDSQGFEPGEEKNFDIVKKFIEERKQKRDIKDKIHAIWFCVPIPCAGGRVFEVGDEKFIKLEVDHVPIIVVFTKLDDLDNKMEMTMDKSQLAKLSKEGIIAEVKSKAETTFGKICLEPLQDLLPGKKPLFVKVSTHEGYKHTLSNLVDLTFENVRKQVAEEPSLVAAIAQRSSPNAKIDASIMIGKRRYWKAIASSADFTGRQLTRCLRVIHNDIVNVWNFPDPGQHLFSEEFKALMSNLVSDLADKNTSDPNKELAANASGLGGIVGIVTPFAGPAAPIVISIAAGVVLAMWVYGVYQRTQGILRCLIGYIIGLTIIMQNIFWLTGGDAQPISRRTVKLAYTSYLRSETRNQIHTQIRVYVEGTNLVSRADRNEILNKLIELIHQHRIKSKEVEQLRRNIKAGEPDEGWDVDVVLK